MLHGDFQRQSANSWRSYIDSTWYGKTTAKCIGECAYVWLWVCGVSSNSQQVSWIIRQTHTHKLNSRTSQPHHAWRYMFTEWPRAVSKHAYASCFMRRNGLINTLWMIACVAASECVWKYMRGVLEKRQIWLLLNVQTQTRTCTREPWLQVRSLAAPQVTHTRHQTDLRAQTVHVFLELRPPSSRVMMMR